MKAMSRLCVLLLIVLPLSAHAYGNRNWLAANQFYSEKLDDTYSWGYNYHAQGRHTTVRMQEDKAGWMYNGNVRSNTATGDYLWEKLEGSAR